MSEIDIIEGLRKVTNHVHLTEREAEEIMRNIMSGNVTNAQLGGFLTALSRFISAWRGGRLMI